MEFCERMSDIRRTSVMSKKNLINGAIVILVFVLTIYYVFAGEDLTALGRSIAACNWRWLLPACLLVVFFIWGESHIIRYLLKQFGIRKGGLSCFLLSAVGFFFSAITPSAGGGQPMQIYFMKKMKIPISISTIILMVVTITYKLVLVLIQVGILLFCRQLVAQYLGGVMYIVYLGMALNVVGIGGLLLLVFCPRLVRIIAGLLVRLLQRLHILKAASRIPARVEESLDKYHEASEYLKRNWAVLFKVQAFTFLQRLALFLVTCCVYRALSLSGTPWTDIVLLQSTISLSVDMLPMPGGMGISEYLFSHIFSQVFGEMLLTGLVLSRGISYYVQLLISGLGTGFAYVHFRDRKENKA